MYYVRSPSLICLESSENSLTLCHFGNTTIYNTFNPALALKLLSEVNNPKTIIQLSRKISSISQGNIKKELAQLLNGHFILKFTQTKSSKNFKKNLFLRAFVRHNGVLDSVSEKITKAKIGIIDLVHCGADFKKVFLESGFKDVVIQKANDPKSLKAVIQKSTFLLVCGRHNQKYLFSKLNQEMVRQKKKWLFVTVDDFGGTVGPVFGSGGGPCYDCTIDTTARQFGSLFRNEDFVDLIDSHGFENNVFMKQSLSQFAAIETIKIISQIARPKTWDGYFDIDMFNFRLKYNHVHPSPTCPTCVPE